MSPTIGVILAGGLSSRMGRDKAMVQVGTGRMIDHVAAALTASDLEIVVAGIQRTGIEFPVVPDAPGGGPVAGLVGVLEAHPGHDLFVTAVDQPLLRPQTVVRLLDRAGDLIAPISGGVPQVTCAVYRSGVLDAARTVLASSRASLRAVAEAVSTVGINESVWRAWGEDGRSWLSIDRAEDVAAAAAAMLLAE